MRWLGSIFPVLILASGLIALAVGVVALRRRPSPMAWPLALLLFAVAAWAIPHAISLGYTGIDQIVFWHRIRYPGTVFAPVLYLVVSLRYAGYQRWLSRRVYGGLAIVPLLTIAAVWTNPSHGLYWASLSIGSVNRIATLVIEPGPWYWINLGYLYLITGAGLLVLGSVFVRSSRIYRKQSGLMLVGGVVPLVTNGAIIFVIGRDSMVDLTTVALAVTGVTFALALFYLDLVEVRPVARDQLVEDLDDGVVVVGPDGRIQDFNATAERVLGDIALGQSTEEDLLADVPSNGGDFVTEVEGRKRSFRIRTTSLTDGHRQEVGQIIYINDVTRLVEREQRLSVLNRILRHNIRNELTVVSGHLAMIEEYVPMNEREHVKTAEEAITRVDEFASKARHIEKTLQKSERTEVVSASTVAELVVAEARETFSEATIEYRSAVSADSEAPVRVIDRELFEMVLRELVENGVIHNDQESPAVTVELEVTDDRTRVIVADNGPGIPESETKIRNEGIETALRHSDGLGLWLVTWMVSLSSGELSFGENHPRGSVVTLILQTAANPSPTPTGSARKSS